jgi:hypothetical protein
MSKKTQSIITSILGYLMWVFGIVALVVPKLELSVFGYIAVFFLGAVAIWFKGDKMMEFIQKNIGSILKK